ncbi:MAG: PAS domain S-box protein [Acidobacteriota bacterium]|nr:PAS domain S-box protein [Acidobacteriota bacterium]MDH3784634.1 PAS domain S-box protein [Acidobacteriota bacterium]
MGDFRVRASRGARNREGEPRSEASGAQTAKSVPTRDSDPERESGFRPFYENIPLMFFKMDAEGTVLSVNRQGAEELGYEQDELVGQSVLRVFHEDDRPAVSRQFAKCAASPDVDSAVKWEFRKIRRDGSTLWVQESVRAVREADGQTVVLVVCVDVTERKQTEQRLLEEQTKLRALRTELSRVEERERRRIAVGLHDKIGQNLAFAKIRLGEIRDAESSDEARRTAEAIGEHLDQAIHATRTLTFELSSPVLYEVGLEAAIRQLADRMGEQNSLRFRVRSAGAIPALPEDLAIVIYRATGEVLLNARKHANCSEAHVAIERVAETVRITVQDDGVGFDAAEMGTTFSPSGGYGLFNIREQMKQIGGRFELHSTPGRGTRAVIAFPLRIEDEGVS